MLSTLTEAVYNIADRFHARRIHEYSPERRVGFLVKVTANKGEFMLPKLRNLNNGLLKIDIGANEGRVLACARCLITSKQVVSVQTGKARDQIYKGKSSDPVDIPRQCGFREQKPFMFPLPNFSDVIFRWTSGG